jgi:hypothetical protein
MTSKQLNSWHEAPAPQVKDRACCIGCGATLVVELEDNAEWGEKLAHYQKYHKTLRKYTGKWRYASNGHFHSQQCTTKWANKQIDSKHKP